MDHGGGIKLKSESKIGMRLYLGGHSFTKKPHVIYFNDTEIREDGVIAGIKELLGEVKRML